MLGDKFREASIERQQLVCFECCLVSRKPFAKGTFPPLNEIVEVLVGDGHTVRGARGMLPRRCSERQEG